MTIEHVIVLCLENRSFDHMLGFLNHPKGRIDGLEDGRFSNRGRKGVVFVSNTAKPVIPVGPDHSHAAIMEQLAVSVRGRPRNAGFVRSYEKAVLGLAPPTFSGLLAPLVNLAEHLFAGRSPMAPERGPLVMACQPTDNVPVLSTLASHFAVCDHWFCSLPGETWPNRNFLHAATSDGEVDVSPRFYTNKTIFEQLEDYEHTWRIYHYDTPQVWAFPKLWNTPSRHRNWFPGDDLIHHIGVGSLATYSFVEPNHHPPVHLTDDHSRLGSSQHPENNLIADAAYDAYDGWADTDFARGEGLIARIYEALRNRPDIFAKTVFLVTYDEHGGLYDHVPPPTDWPSPGPAPARLGRLFNFLLRRAGGSASGFNFRMLGPRVPTVVISPLVPAMVSHTHYDHASVPSTLRALFAPDAPSLTCRDRYSPSFHDLLRLDRPRTDLPSLARWVADQPSATGPPTATSGIPDGYDFFLEQSELMRREMLMVQEPEFADVDVIDDVQSADVARRAFLDAAERHRAESILSGLR